MLRLITAPAECSLSDKIVLEMVNKAVKEPEKKFFIIVPEQFTLQTQKRVVRLHPGHACMNIDVVSFDRLAHVVLAKLGKDTGKILDDVGKALVLRNVLDSVRDDLHIYAAKIHMVGFVEEMKSLITEFKQYGIDDNALFLMQQSAAEKGNLLEGKLQDIRLIYSKFNESIRDKYTTSEEVLDVFARSIKESAFLKESEIFLDGFTGFTPIQYKIISQMISCGSDITATVVIPDTEKKSSWAEYDLFALANETIARLKTVADECGIKVEESAFDEPVTADRKVDIVSCIDMGSEIEYAAGEILRLVRQEGARYRDIAVLSTDMESYYSRIKNTFDEAGITAFIDYKSEFSGNMLVRFILGALQISAKGLTYENVFNFLKSGLVGLSEDEVSILENYCLEFNIKGKARWEGKLSANRSLSNGQSAWDLDLINAIKDKVSRPLLKCYGFSYAGKKRPGKAYCMVVSTLLDEFGVKEQIEKISLAYKELGELSLSKEYDQIFEKVTELLEKIEMLVGTEYMEVKTFYDILESGINEIKIGIIPPSVDSLIVGDLTRTRLDKVKYLFILGVNDGKLPSAGSGSALFTQKERAYLRKDFEIAPTVLENIYVQRYYLYLAFNKPSNNLYLTYSATGLSGDSQGPSCILEDIDELVFGIDDIRRSSAGEKPDIYWKKKAKKSMAMIIRKAKEESALQEEQDLSGLMSKKEKEIFDYFASCESEAVRTLIRGACFCNIQTPLDSQVAVDLYGDVLKGSVSRYESYYSCPYRHFLGYGLRLEERREYEVQATDLGSIYHDALEKYSTSLKEQGRSFRDISDEDSEAIIKESVKTAIADNESDVLESSARNIFLQKRIEEITVKTVDVLRDHVKAGLFEPSEFELGFEEKISSNVSFKGKIDRVDIYDAGDVFVKIIDYKSGSKKFNIKDIYSGMQLQLVAYMSSAIKEVKKNNPGKNVRPAGVYYYLVADKYIKSDEDTEKKNQMSGLTLADDDVIHAIDSGLGSDGRTKSNIIPVALSKNGIDSRSQIANESEFEHLISFVNDKIVNAGEEIRQGDVSLRPEKGDSSHNGCTFCPYGDICKFEAGHFGTDYKNDEAEKSVMEEEIYGRI